MTRMAVVPAPFATCGWNWYSLCEMRVSTLKRAPVAASRAIYVQIALAALIVFSFIWYWQHAFRGSVAVLAVLLLPLLFHSHRARQDSLRELGLRLDTAFDAAKILVPVGVAAIGAALLAGHALGSLRFPPADVALPMAGKLIAFGMLQQYLLLAFFYRGIDGLVRSSVAAILATAVLFAAFHFPNPFLVAVTFAGAVFSASIYRRAPNLWVTGIVHGWVSFTLYYALPKVLTGGLRVGPEYWTR